MGNTLGEGQAVIEVDTREAAEIIGVTFQMMCTYVKEGRIEPLSENRPWKFDREVIEQFSKDRTKEIADRTERGVAKRKALQVYRDSSGSKTTSKLTEESIESAALAMVATANSSTTRHLETIMQRLIDSDTKWRDGYSKLTDSIFSMHDVILKRINMAEERASRMEAQHQDTIKLQQQLLDQVQEREQKAKDADLRRRMMEKSMSKLTSIATLVLPHLLKKNGVDLPPGLLNPTIEKPEGSKPEIVSTTPTIEDKGAPALTSFVGNLSVKMYMDLRDLLGDHCEALDNLMSEDGEAPEKMRSFCQQLMKDGATLGKLGELFNSEQMGVLQGIIGPYLV